MTDVTITVGGNVVSNDTIDVDTWRDRLTSIGRCRLRADNSADKWGNTFVPNDAIVISINGTVVWQGFVDDVKPYLPPEGVITNEIIITGRDHGRYLTDFLFTKNYVDGWAADIVDDILNILGDPLTYTDDGQYGGEAKIKYEGIRTTLGDALRDICELSGRDFYIDNTGNLELFEAGTIDSTVDLDMVADSATNNLLTFDEVEQEGFSIKNHIEIHAGSVKGHWTNETANEWSAGGGGAVADEYVQYIQGDASIELTSTGAISRIYLDFAAGACGYSTSIDLSQKLCEARVLIKGEIAGLNYFNFNPYLVDTTNRKIVFTRRGPNAFGGKGSSKGWTEGIEDWNRRNVWSALSYPLGASSGNPVKSVALNGYWHAVGWDPTIADFDWANVKTMGFEFPHANNGVIWIDGWCIPSIEARAIVEDAGGGSSQALYGKRMFTEYKRELKSYKQLFDYATAILALRKDPLQKFKCVAHGQVGTKYAAQTVDVNTPVYGLNDVPYTITALHHKIHHNRDIRGWDFLTEYELAEQDAPAYRVIRDDNPMEILMDRLRRENRGFKGGLEADDIFLGDIISGSYVDATTGATFPTDPANGDFHLLTADVAGPPVYYGTADGVLYQYEESSDTWLRGPIVLHRAAQPPVNGEVTGDEWFDTANDIRYRWTGAAWQQISSLNIGDAPDIATFEWPTDQLAIEVRPWTSNLSIIWDEADYNDFDWGTLGNEGGGGVDATIHYADGVSVDINCAGNVNIADGEWYVYWDEAQMTGGDYDLQWTQNYALASGVGKGLVALVNVDAATPEAPTIVMLNSYKPAIGAGAITAHAIWSKHISTDWLTGKNYRTAVNVGEVAGPAGIRFSSTGLYGYSGGVQKTFELLAASGIVSVYGTGMFKIRKADGTEVGALDGTIVDLGAGNQDTVKLGVGNGQVLMLDAFGHTIYLDSSTDYILIDDDWLALRPMTARSVDLGTPTYPFRYFVPRTVVASRPAAAAGVVGLLWCSREGAGTKEKLWICMRNDANAYEWVQLGITT